METSVVLACDGGHIRVSRIGENLPFSHHLFHRIDLVIVVVSMRGPAPEERLLPAPGPSKGRSTGPDCHCVPYRQGRRGCSRQIGWRPASSGRNARGPGATGGRMGVLQVGRAFVQYAQALASGSRPSWSRGGSHKPRAGADVGPQPPGPDQELSGASGVEPGVRASGCAARTPLSRRRRQPSVHSTDISEPATEAAGEDRWNSAVCPRRAAPERS